MRHVAVLLLAVAVFAETGIEPKIEVENLGGVLEMDFHLSLDDLLNCSIGNKTVRQQIEENTETVLEVDVHISLNTSSNCAAPNETCTTTTTTTEINPTECDPKWTKFNGSCFKFYDRYPEVFTWSAAGVACESVGAQLASIHSRKEKDFLISLVEDQRFCTGVYIGLKRDPGGQYHWIDESPFDYVLINSGNNGTHAAELFMYTECQLTYRVGTWADVDEKDPLPNYLCKKTPSQFRSSTTPVLNDLIAITNPPTTNSTEKRRSPSSQLTTIAFNSTSSVPITTPSPPTSATSAIRPATRTSINNKTRYPECLPGWELYKDYCYFFEDLPYQWLTRTQSIEFCRSQGGDLASIHSKDENDFLSKYTAETECDVPAIGLEMDAGGEYKWTDGSPFDFKKEIITKAEDSPPSFFTLSSYECSKEGEDGTWGAYPQWKPLVYAFICKKPADKSKTQKKMV